jgi:nuclear transport factor 2 (NTF2) superfamily protein
MTTKIRPPFTEETACIKVKAADDAWNTRRIEAVRANGHR